MKNSRLIVSSLFAISMVFFSCESSNVLDPDETLETAGFQGTLPDGTAFGIESVSSTNGTMVMGVNNIYTGHHILSLKNLETSWSISLELPGVIFSSTPPLAESNGEDLEAFFLEHYSYETILEKLNAEKQKADANPNYSGIENFRVTVTNEAEFYAYLHDGMNPAEAGKLRILEVTEGIQKNQQGQNVRKIEVLVSLDLNLKASNESVNPQMGNLKGLALFKFREDFHQGN